MNYMDQGMDCKLCGREHSQFSTGVCLTCQAAERDAKAKAEWDAKTPIEQALHYLEKWADPQAMTFNKHDAKFVLGVVSSVAALASQAINGAVPDGWVLVPRKMADEQAKETVYNINRKYKVAGPLTDFLARQIWEWAIYAKPATPSPAQPAPVVDGDKLRAAGRAEAMAILMQLDPETGIDDYTGWRTSGAPEDEGSAYWKEDKLRELFSVDGSLADMMDKAEAEYWRYKGLQSEAEGAKHFAANMQNSGKVREVLAKHGEYDLMADLCQPPADAAPDYKAITDAKGKVTGYVMTNGARMPDYAAPVEVKPVAYRVTFDDFRHFSGAIASGRDYVQFKKPELDNRFFEGCDSLVITPLYTAQPSPAQDEALSKQVKDAAQRLQKAADILQQFKHDWMRVPYFADRVNKATRDAISAAIAPIVNLDAVGNPLDADAIRALAAKNGEGKS